MAENTSATTPTIDTPTERIGRYEIIHKLASGGMGEVYLARSIGAAGFQKHIVIKRLLPHLVEQSQFVDGLIREAKLLVMLDHPNIVQVLDLGMEGHDYFMAMEYVHGYNLATIIHYCAQNRWLIPEPVCAIISMEVLAGLQYAHELIGLDGMPQNIIHRDVSPQNVMISNEGRVKLTDFGIAKIINESEGEFTQSLKGKFRYMAPEVVEGGRIDKRYDLFAVGILLFEALCRRHLFSGSNDLNILSQVRKAAVPPINRYHPNVTPAMVEVVNHALAKDPMERYQTAREFADAIREAMRPIAESEAIAQLRAFVIDLYARPDFPINKPKLPDLNAAFSGVTRSIVLESRIELNEITKDTNVSQPISPPQEISSSSESIKKDDIASVEQVIPVITQSKRAILGLYVGLIVLGGAVAYLIFTSHNKASSDKPLPVIVLPRIPDQSIGTGLSSLNERDLGSSSQDDAIVTSEQKVDLRRKSTKVISPPIKPFLKPKPFNQAMGVQAFRKHETALTNCFTKFSSPQENEVRFRIKSSIEANGKVVEATIEPASLSNTPFGRCVVQVARSIRYPKHDQPLITFVQPLQLKRSP